MSTTKPYQILIRFFLLCRLKHLSLGELNDSFNLFHRFYT